MGKYQQVWQSLKDEEYRREYSSDVGTGLAFQIKLLREKNGWTQEHLAQRIGKQQETISQWENPNYRSYTLNSLKSLAAAFDVALMVKFAPFSELVGWTTGLTPQHLAPPSFSQEQAAGRMLSSATHSDFAGAANAYVDDLLNAASSGPSAAQLLLLKAIIAERIADQPREESVHAVAAYGDPRTPS